MAGGCVAVDRVGADARTPFRSNRSGGFEVSAARNTVGEERQPLGHHRM
ncbi:hypothetical protein Spla01_02076 [Streptomyces platensis]|uniref:Uncharacterized protein n=1 Tax=Streptomyces platensis TaxID=58346 RepID=A0ABX3XTG0_STRPT|nr:hypothetical protein BG653_04422 [Streptomyces platensis]